MRPTFLTGATGFLGSYVAAELLRDGQPVSVLVRARDEASARGRLWDAWQLHFDAPTFREHLERRVRIVRGDLTSPGLGLSEADRRALLDRTESVIHVAAALNRRSERACLNVNLRGTLEVVRLARGMVSAGGLRRFSEVSTVSVAGERFREVVDERGAIDWDRRDWDAYGRTKKFAEQLVRELEDLVPITIFRPSIVLGDSGRPETTQFDMARAFVFLSGLPVLPLRPLDRIDIVPADWVGRAIATLHRKAEPRWDVYHLSAGEGASTYREITRALAAGGGRAPGYAPGLERPFRALVGALGRRAPGRVGGVARLLDVFLPYLYMDTVFANDRAVDELGSAPAPFPAYAAALRDFCVRHDFRYPRVPWTESPRPARPAPAPDAGVPAATAPEVRP